MKQYHVNHYNRLEEKRMRDLDPKKLYMHQLIVYDENSFTTLLYRKPKRPSDMSYANCNFEEFIEEIEATEEEAIQIKLRHGKYYAPSEYFNKQRG